MKSKFLLKVYVFVFALILSSFTKNRDNLITGYYYNPFVSEVHEVLTDCSLTGVGQYCLVTVGPYRYQLYLTNDLDLIPDNELKKVY
ncbi:DUF6520 family protein [Flavivirga rizhaonensis]|uniref:Uncharacterized protein n=1 Tax=Flavivirga rizhaonensis TaxID=2559571 RepID=A0A4S1DZD8_9FLAO|nr:DUF6520 family protein [Flavivirga rizhaonensis]TGV03607.1 hypothetical protein EM932_06160 [Flavivirga rizhaonensis]